MLWRLEHGEIDGLKSKAVVLMIGTNNVGSNSPEQIAEGIEAIVTKLRDEMPETKVLLLGVFPRGKTRAEDVEYDETDPRIGEINERIADLGQRDGVTSVDLQELSDA